MENIEKDSDKDETENRKKMDTEIKEERTFEVQIPPEPPPVKCVRISKN